MKLSTLLLSAAAFFISSTEAATVSLKIGEDQMQIDNSKANNYECRTSVSPAGDKSFILFFKDSQKNVFFAEVFGLDVSQASRHEIELPSAKDPEGLSSVYVRDFRKGIEYSYSAAEHPQQKCSLILETQAQEISGSFFCSALVPSQIHGDETYAALPVSGRFQCQLQLGD